MMVPSTIGAIGAPIPTPADTRRVAPSRFLAGYLTIWAAVGVLLLVADGLLHTSLEQIPALTDRPWIVSGALLFFAGAWQFAPARRQCLRRCRTELAVLASDLPADRQSSFHLGMTHGVSCSGSCWMLMLAMMTFGSGAIATISLFGLAAVVLLEKTRQHGEEIAVLTGVGLTAAGVVVLVLQVG
jgi:predicted metal-binding membrane protein